VLKTKPTPPLFGVSFLPAPDRVKTFKKPILAQKVVKNPYFSPILEHFSGFLLKNQI
jgi:hypothetical protein